MKLVTEYAIISLIQLSVGMINMTAVPTMNRILVLEMDCVRVGISVLDPVVTTGLIVMIFG